MGFFLSFFFVVVFLFFSPLSIFQHLPFSFDFHLKVGKRVAHDGLIINWIIS